MVRQKKPLVFRLFLSGALPSPGSVAESSSVSGGGEGGDRLRKNMGTDDGVMTVTLEDHSPRLEPWEEAEREAVHETEMGIF